MGPADEMRCSGWLSVDNRCETPEASELRLTRQCARPQRSCDAATAAVAPVEILTNRAESRPPRAGAAGGPDSGPDPEPPVASVCIWPDSSGRLPAELMTCRNATDAS